ncbi:MAG: formylglycine-generating enzyme family protein [Nitrospiria bacterium]
MPNEDLWCQVLRKTLILFLLMGGCYDVRPVAVPPSGMVLIPAGSFIMGASEKDGIIGIEVGVDQVPRHVVYLNGFYIDHFETTVEEYAEFVRKTRYHEPYSWSTPSGRKFSPTDAVSDVSSVDADAYCHWKGKRLPTESEWEKAARGTDGRKWPWGNIFSKDKTNTWDLRLNKIVSPGSFPGDVSPYGVYDMGGNVMEWTSSWYEPYPGNSLKRDSFGHKFKILRGGTWTESANPFARTTHRFPVIPTLAQPDFGIRCAKDIIPPATVH